MWLTAAHNSTGFPEDGHLILGCFYLCGCRGRDPRAAGCPQSSVCCSCAPTHTFMSLSPSWRTLWAALWAVSILIFWPGRGFLLPYGPLSWFKGVRVCKSLTSGLRHPALPRLNAVYPVTRAISFSEENNKIFMGLLACGSCTSGKSF